MTSQDKVTSDQLPDSLITVAIFGLLLLFCELRAKTWQNYFNSGVILFFYLIQSSTKYPCIYWLIYLFKLPFPIFPTFSHTLFHKNGKLPHSPATIRPELYTTLMIKDLLHRSKKYFPGGKCSRKSKAGKPVQSCPFGYPFRTQASFQLAQPV